jgi:hypothetical protein
MGFDPKKALTYAQKASTLGDISAKHIEAAILDIDPSLETQKSSLTRLQTISSLISKIDPSFAYNSTSCEKIRKSGFIAYLTGKIDFFSLWKCSKSLRKLVHQNPR